MLHRWNNSSIEYVLYIFAERLSVMLLIMQCSWLTFVCIYIYISVTL